MAEKSINTRLKLKYDTLTNWNTKNPVLLAGEAAICEVPADSNAVVQEPAILIKVGDGTSNFKALPWVSGIAADVYDWAKASAKPEYNADEIEGLTEFVQDISDIDTNTEYSLTLDGNIIKVQKKDIGGTYADYQTIDLSSAFNAKADKVSGATAGNFAGLDASGNLTDSGKKAADFATAAQGAKADTAVQSVVAGTANGTIKVDGSDIAVTGLGTAAYTAASDYATAGHNHDDKYAAKAATEEHIANGDIHVTADQKTAWTTGATKAGEAEAAIAAIKDGTEIDSFADVETELAKYQLSGDYATKEEAQGYADAKDEAIAAAQKAADDAQAAVDVLEGEDAGKSVRAIAAEEIAAQLVPETAAEALDSLEEIAAWIQAHPGDAAAMNAAILALQKQLQGIDAGEGTVKKYVDDAISALNVGQYALAADLTALAGRVEALEAKAHEHANKEVLDGISAEKVAQWDAAQANVLENIAGVEGSIADKTFTVTGVSTDLLEQGADTLIFDCGNATI